RASSCCSANIINMCFAASRCGPTFDGRAALAALRGDVLSGDPAVGPGRHSLQPVRPAPDAGGGAELDRDEPLARRKGAWDPNPTRRRDPAGPPPDRGQ